MTIDPLPLLGRMLDLVRPQVAAHADGPAPHAGRPIPIASDLAVTPVTAHATVQPEPEPAPTLVPSLPSVVMWLPPAPPPPAPQADVRERADPAPTRAQPETGVAAFTLGAIEVRLSLAADGVRAAVTTSAALHGRALDAQPDLIARIELATGLTATAEIRATAVEREPRGRLDVTA